MRSYSDGFSLGCIEEEPELDFEPEEGEGDESDEEILLPEVVVRNVRNDRDHFQVLSSNHDSFFDGSEIINPFDTVDNMNSDESDVSDSDDLPVSDGSYSENEEELLKSASLNDIVREPCLTPLQISRASLEPLQNSNELEYKLPESPTQEMFDDSSDSRTSFGNELETVPDENIMVDKDVFTLREQNDDYFYSRDADNNVGCGYDDFDYPQVKPEKSYLEASTSSGSFADNNNICIKLNKPLPTPSEPSTSTRRRFTDNTYISNEVNKPIPARSMNGCSQKQTVIDDQIKERTKLNHKPQSFQIVLSGKSRKVSSMPIDVPTVQPSLESPFRRPNLVDSGNILRNLPNGLTKKPKGIIEPPLIKQRARKAVRKPVPKSAIRRNPFKKVCWLEMYSKWHEEEFRLVSTDEDLKRMSMMASDSETSSVRSRNSFTSEPSTKLSFFKEPVKRPPTRMKPPVPDNHFEEDKMSVISLMTSATIFDNSDDGVAHRQITPNSSQAFRNYAEQREPQEKVANWLHVGQQQSDESFDNVPRIYLGLCHKYFFSGSCKNPGCVNSHVLFGKKSRLNQLRFVSKEELKSSYDFAKEKPQFFITVLPVFAEVFAMKGYKDELISMATIVLEEDIPRILKAVSFKIILENLVKTDLSNFEDATFYIMSNLNLRTHPLFNQTALEAFITMEQPEKCWPSIRGLFVLNEKITDNTMATKFISSLIKEPVNPRLCHEIYKFLKSRKSLSFSSVNINVKNRYYSIVQMEAANEGIRYPEIQVKIVPDSESCDFQRINSSPPSYQASTSSEERWSTPLPELPFFDKTKPPPNFIRQSKLQFNNEPYRFSNKSFPAPRGVQNRIDKYKNFQFNRIETPKTGPVMSISSEHGNEDALFGQNVEFSSDFASLRAMTPDVEYPKFQGQAKRRHCSSGSDQDPFPAKRQALDPPFTAIPTAPSAACDKWKSYNSHGSRYDPIRDYQITHGEEAVPSLETHYPNSNEEAVHSQNTASVPLNTNRQNVLNTDDQGQSHIAEFVEKPRYGQIKYNDEYKFDVSLHHLYLEEVFDNEISTKSISDIYECLRKGDGRMFLAVFERNSDCSSIRNFLSACVSEYVSMNKHLKARYIQLLRSLKWHTPLFMNNVVLRAGLEVLTMNIFYFLFQRNLLEDAYEILKWFPDFDTLVTSASILGEVPIMGLTITRRYFLIARICLYANPHLFVGIMTNSNLQFYGCYEKWPYKKKHHSDIYKRDLDIRNKFLHKFFQEIYPININAVLEMYRFRHNMGLWMFDPGTDVNSMFKDLLKKKSKDILRKIYPDLEVLVGKLDADTLRVYQIFMYPHLEIREKFNLFQICQKQKIYPELEIQKVPVSTVHISTTMHTCEIELIILYYFYQLTELQSLPFGNGNLFFKVSVYGLDNSKKDYFLLNHVMSVPQTLDIIKSTLKAKINIECEEFQVERNMLIVSRDQLCDYLMRNVC